MRPAALIVGGAVASVLCYRALRPRKKLPTPIQNIVELPSELLAQIFAYLDLDAVRPGAPSKGTPSGTQCIGSTTLRLHFYARLQLGGKTSTFGSGSRRTGTQESTLILDSLASIYCVGMHSPNVVISGSADTMLKAWTITASPTCSHVFRGHTSGVRSLCTNKTTLASGGSDGSIRLWDIDSGAPLLTIPSHVDEVKGLQFIDECLLSGGVDGSCRLYDLRISQPQRVYETNSPIFSLQGDSTGRLVVGLGNGAVQYWDMRMDRIVHTFSFHTSWVHALHYRGDSLITGAFDGSLVRWDLQYLLKMCAREVRAVRSLRFDESKLVTTTWEGLMGVWSPDTLVLHSSWKYNNILYCHDQDDTKMITGSYDATLQIWDFSRGDIQPHVADVD